MFQMVHFVRRPDASVERTCTAGSTTNELDHVEVPHPNWRDEHVDGDWGPSLSLGMEIAYTVEGPMVTLLTRWTSSDAHHRRATSYINNG